MVYEATLADGGNGAMAWEQGSCEAPPPSYTPSLITRLTARAH